MTIALPQPVPSSSGWQFMGYKRVKARTTAAAGGIATTTLAQLATDEQWLIDRAVVTCSSSSTTSVRLYDGLVDASALVSGSDTGNFDEADYPGGLLIDSGGQLVAVWSGAANGAIGTLNLQVRQLRRIGG